MIHPRFALLVCMLKHCLTQHVNKFPRSRWKDKLSLDVLDKEDVEWRMINKAETIYLENLFTCCVRLFLCKYSNTGVRTGSCQTTHRFGPLHQSSYHRHYIFCNSSIVVKQATKYIIFMGHWYRGYYRNYKAIPSTSLPHGHSVVVLSCDTVYCWQHPWT